MSLAKYTHTRLIVQRPEVPAYDSIRAMQDNHVGAVIVHDRKQVVGIVTDRDLALVLVGENLDPLETPVGEVMSTPVAAVPSTATEAEAAQLMLEHHVRRIPIVDDATAVGMITLDDLILEQSVEPATLAAIVRVQLAEPSRLKRAGDVHPTRAGARAGRRRTGAAGRYTAHAALAYDAFMEHAQAATGLESRERAEVAVEEVLSGIIRRITPEEAHHLVAQLPSSLRERLAGAAHGPDLRVTRAQLDEAVERRLRLGRGTGAAVVRCVWAALAATISAGELEDVRSQLPADMKDLLTSQATEQLPH